MSRQAGALTCAWVWVATLSCGSRTGLDTLSTTVVGVDGGTITPSCAAGGLVVLASPTDGSMLVGSGAIAVDATSVYWIALAPEGATTGGSVMKVPLCGGTATTLATITIKSGQIVAGALAVDDTNVYWVSHDQAGTPPGDQIMKVPLGGGTSTPIAAGRGTTLAVDATSLYWTNETGGVVKVPLAGGTPVPLANPEPQGIGNLVVDASGAYFTSQTYGIQRLPLDGGDYTTIVPDGTAPGYTLMTLALSGGNLYWGAYVPQKGMQTGTVSTIPVQGGTPSTLAAITTPIDSLVVDGTSVYWLTPGNCPGATCTGIVMKVPVTGGTPVTVASFPDASGAIAVDATSVYWTSGGTVMKMTPK